MVMTLLTLRNHSRNMEIQEFHRLVLKSQTLIPKSKKKSNFESQVENRGQKPKLTIQDAFYLLVVLLAWVMDFQVKFLLFSNMHK
jgi:NADH:ubiquinone oxidoreductase subunit 3 (subunit A)